MDELNKLEKLEVEGIADKRGANYCELHCKQYFVSNKRLNGVLYVIGTVMLILSGAAVGYAIPNSAAVGSVVTRQEQQQKEIESLQSIHATMDSVYATVKFIKNMKELYAR
jgi:hypothetical protein